MPKVNNKTKNGSTDLSVSIISEPHTKGIKNIQSLMSKIKEYYKRIGALNEQSVNVSFAKDNFSLEDFCDSMEPYIINILKAYPIETIFGSLKQRKISKQSKQYIDKYNDFKAREETKIKSTDNNNFLMSNYVDKMELWDIFFDILYEGKEIHQEDKFEKSAFIIRTLCALLIKEYLIFLKKLLKENSQTVEDIWKITYEIGLLQGEICLIESHLDPDFREIHHKKKASELKDKDWKVKYEKIEEKNKQLETLLREPLKYAEDEWEKRYEIIYHDKMASKLYEKFKNLGIDRETYKEKLKPIAKKYRYSTFSKAEFKSPLDITILCQAISSDYPDIKLKSPQNTVVWLNELLANKSFAPKWYKLQKKSPLAKEVIRSISKIISYKIECKLKDHMDITEEDDENFYVKTNRTILEHAYPQITPKSLKNGLMRGWEGISTKERY